MIFIKDLKNNSDDYQLSEEFVNSIPVYCPICDAPLKINEILTEITCSNPLCTGNIESKIKYICKQLDILEFNGLYIRSFIENYKPDSALEIFKLEKGMTIGRGIPKDITEKIINKITKRKKFLLWEYINIANLSYIGTYVEDIFEDYSDLDQFYEELEEEGLEFLKRKIKVNNDFNNVIDIFLLRIYETLLEHKEELLENITNVTIVKK